MERISSLIESIAQDPYHGIGKQNLSGICYQAAGAGASIKNTG
jgi:Txe/YoeB family toxin of Txe-Axe toxin-antitoxin module